MKLTELQESFLLSFPYQRHWDGTLYPLSHFRIADPRLSTRQSNALIEKGLIIEQTTMIWALTEAGEKLLRELDPEWAVAADAPQNVTRRPRG